MCPCRGDAVKGPSAGQKPVKQEPLEEEGGRENGESGEGERVGSDGEKLKKKKKKKKERQSESEVRSSRRVYYVNWHPMHW